MIITQGTPEWYAARIGHVTASRMSAVLAKIKSGEAADRKNYRTEKVVERLTGKSGENGFVTAPMQRGTDTEPKARTWYANKFDVLPTLTGFRKHPTIEWLGASVDSEIEAGKGGLEIKCPNTAQHIAALLYGMDSKHMPQVQTEIWIMGWEWVDFVSYDDRMPEGLDGYVQRVYRDDKYIAMLEEEVWTFLGEVEVTLTKLQEKLNGKAEASTEVEAEAAVDDQHPDSGAPAGAVGGDAPDQGSERPAVAGRKARARRTSARRDDAGEGAAGGGAAQEADGAKG